MYLFLYCESNVILYLLCMNLLGVHSVHTNECCYHTCPSPPQEIHTLNSDALGTSDITSEDGTTLNAIGHALIQMQQGGQSQPSSIPQGSQLILTRSSSSGAEAGQNRERTHCTLKKTSVHCALINVV